MVWVTTTLGDERGTYRQRHDDGADHTCAQVALLTRGDEVLGHGGVSGGGGFDSIRCWFTAAAAVRRFYAVEQSVEGNAQRRPCMQPLW